MLHRPRRLRKNPLVREMVAETKLSKDMLVYPHFVVPGKGYSQDIEAMPGVKHFSTDVLLKEVEQGLRVGLNKIMLFGVGEQKSEDAHAAYDPNALVQQAVRQLKKQFGDDLYVITDVCVCSYTSHGHCGILHDGEVKNDETVALMSKIALSHAEAGADMLAPSDMMDGRVLGIRESLEQNGFEQVAIMTHATKFASSYYGPFREAADCAPGHGDRKSYQMDFRNPTEALREALLDAQQGADVLMIKPALAYLDIIALLKQHTQLPLACYNVSGEYAMIKAAAQRGWLDEQKVVMETMYAFARAGASIITSYHSKDILENNWL